MLLVVTANPTIDRSLYVPKLTVGRVHRTGEIHLAAGGKGLNVTRAALTLGHEVVVTAPLAGHTGRMFADLAAADGLPADWYWQSTGETRNCVLINHTAGDATVVNESGSAISGTDWAGFTAKVEQLARSVPVVTFSGSLLPGIEPEALGALARSLTAERAIYLDSSGEALREVLVQPKGLHLKVNRQELAQGLGLASSQTSTQDLLQAGKSVLARGAVLVVVTLGDEGALVISPDGCWHANAPIVDMVSTVGSGDCLMAGLALARLAGQDLPAALAYGVACGAANAMTRLPGRFAKSAVETLLPRISVNTIASGEQHN